VDVPNLRLHNQGLNEPTFKEPGDAVAWLGAVQAQDYTGAKWALGMRLQGATDASLDAAFNAGQILRTHVMRPTWHFVAPADIRWLLSLTAPRVHAVNASLYRRLELDAPTFTRSHGVLEKALEDGKHLTRQELRGTLQRAGISTQTGEGSLRLGYLMMRAELDGIICSGPRRGKQFTYALLQERAPNAKDLHRDEALAELTRRYFTSHGPALVKDFVWWSGLTTADARAGLEMLASDFSSETIAGKTYWFPASKPPPGATNTRAYLLPNYDEYIIGYTDHTGVFDPSYAGLLELVFPHSIVVEARVIGTWRRAFHGAGMTITTKLFAPLTGSQTLALASAAENYARFLNAPVTLI
jgi:hypothetical protein